MTASSAAVTIDLRQVGGDFVVWKAAPLAGVSTRRRRR